MYFIFILTVFTNIFYYIVLGLVQTQIEIYKKTFKKAKTAMHECLNACPVDVIKQFFNHSWWFIDAYQKGLTGKAAE